MSALGHVALAAYAMVVMIAAIAILGRASAREDGVWGRVNRQIASTPTTLGKGLVQGAWGFVGAAALLLAAVLWPFTLPILWRAERRTRGTTEVNDGARGKA